MHRFFSSLLIVVSINTAGNPEWKGVVDALAQKHADMEVSTLVAAPDITGCKAGIMSLPHRYIAFVMTPEEARFGNILKLSRIVRELDDDIYEDAIWGIVTGPTAKDALRMAASDEPKSLDRCLATTGVSERITPGRVVCFKDSGPAGCWWIKDDKGERADFQREGDLGAYFADAWAACDPQLLISASHASQFNLELPFSRGNIVSANGKLGIGSSAAMIDYATGQAKTGASSFFLPLADPASEKIWIAPGNCLIADNRGNDNMLMAALGWGKCNQFVGYMSTTWFGFTGWGTLEQFSRYRRPLNESHYAAKQLLLRELGGMVSNSHAFRPEIADAAGYDKILSEAQNFEFLAPHPISDMTRFAGLLWDRDATVFYGDPVKRYALKERTRPLPAWEPGLVPQLVVFPDVRSGRKLVAAPAGFEVEVYDDFALVTKWPELKPGWREQLVFE